MVTQIQFLNKSPACDKGPDGFYRYGEEETGRTLNPKPYLDIIKPTASEILIIVSLYQSLKSRLTQEFTATARGQGFRVEGFGFRV